MPLGGGECARVAIDNYVSNVDTRRRIEQSLGELVPVPAASRADESRNFRFANAAGVVGFINPVSEPYCGSCNCMRLTADGKFHLCLLNDDELDVKRAIRSGGGVEAVREILLRAVEAKPTGHALHRSALLLPGLLAGAQHPSGIDRGAEYRFPSRRARSSRARIA
jgi:cyclic pyranopterin phosphate synthase